MMRSAVWSSLCVAAVAVSGCFCRDVGYPGEGEGEGELEVTAAVLVAEDGRLVEEPLALAANAVPMFAGLLDAQPTLVVGPQAYGYAVERLEVVRHPGDASTTTEVALESTLYLDGWESPGAAAIDLNRDGYDDLVLTTGTSALVLVGAARGLSVLATLDIQTAGPPVAFADDRGPGVAVVGRYQGAHVLRLNGRSVVDETLDRVTGFGGDLCLTAFASVNGLYAVAKRCEPTQLSDEVVVQFGSGLNAVAVQPLPLVGLTLPQGQAGALLLAGLAFDAGTQQTGDVVVQDLSLPLPGATTARGAVPAAPLAAVDAHGTGVRTLLFRDTGDWAIPAESFAVALAWDSRLIGPFLVDIDGDGDEDVVVGRAKDIVAPAPNTVRNECTPLPW